MISIATNRTVAFGFKTGAWTKWLPYKEFKEQHLNLEPNYWKVAPETLVMETDFPQLKMNREFSETICSKLAEQKISYRNHFSGNKSFHVESDWPELILLEDKQREKAKELLAKHLLNPNLFGSLDKSNFKTARLVGIPGQPHRLTGNTKIQIDFRDFGENKISEAVWKKIKAIPKKNPIDANQKNVLIPTGKKCLLCEWSFTHALPVSERNLNLVPNIVALYPEAVWQQCADAQGKTLLEFQNWAKRNPGFSCFQLREWAKNEKVQLEEICKVCGGFYGK